MLDENLHPSKPHEHSTWNEFGLYIGELKEANQFSLQMVIGNFKKSSSLISQVITKGVIPAEWEFFALLLTAVREKAML